MNVFVKGITVSPFLTPTREAFIAMQAVAHSNAMGLVLSEGALNH